MGSPTVVHELALTVWNENRVDFRGSIIPVCSTGRVDFEVYGWDDPPEEFRREYDLFTPRPLQKSPPGSNQQMQLF
jgi:hypothetical protein